MSHGRLLSRALLVVGPVVLVAVASAAPPAPSKPAPRPEPIAETKLLMDGLNGANFRGLDKLLRQKPPDTETWVYLRGQALLIAETGNLLMLRPPRNAGENAWMERATEMREAATGLARAAASKDYERSRAGLVTLANACNHCHQTFRIDARVTPFAEAPEGGNAP